MFLLTLAVSSPLVARCICSTWYGSKHIHLSLPAPAVTQPARNWDFLERTIERESTPLSSHTEAASSYPQWVQHCTCHLIFLFPQHWTRCSAANPRYRVVNGKERDRKPTCIDHYHRWLCRAQGYVESTGLHRPSFCAATAWATIQRKIHLPNPHHVQKISQKAKFQMIFFQKFLCQKTLEVFWSVASPGKSGSESQVPRCPHSSSVIIKAWRSSSFHVTLKQYCV